MNYNSEENELRIDLSEEQYNPALLLQHEDVKSIRIDGYKETIELPVEIKDLNQLKKLYVYVKDLKQLYAPPVNLEKLTNIKDLTLWAVLVLLIQLS